MRIDSVWQELEAEAQRENPGTWLTRFALPQPGQPLLVAIEPVSRRRALLLPLPRPAIPVKRQWPECRGLEVFSAALSGESHLGVRLRDPSCADVFAALAEDVAPRVADAPDAGAAANAMLARLRRWQKFLSAGTAGLSTEQQRGLFGELHTLREQIVPALGAVAAVQGWRAPLAANQDFQLAGGAIEIKTTSAKQPQVVRVVSERQLDDTGIAALFLHVVVVDEREVDGGVKGVGETLPDLVRSLRRRLQPEVSVSEAFEDRLLDAGYLESDAHRYENRHFTLRLTQTFRLRDGFPRLVERDLPAGVGDVSYSLSLAACEPYAVSVAEMVAALQTPADPNHRNPRRL